jgi:hypothetical protein
VVVKKNSLCVFSILMFGEEAVCSDGLFVSAIFRESGFYLNSLTFAVFFFGLRAVLILSRQPKYIKSA